MKMRTISISRTSNTITRARLSASATSCPLGDGNTASTSLGASGRHSVGEVCGSTSFLEEEEEEVEFEEEEEEEEEEDDDEFEGEGEEDHQDLANANILEATSVTLLSATSMSCVVELWSRCSAPMEGSEPTTSRWCT